MGKYLTLKSWMFKIEAPFTGAYPKTFTITGLCLTTEAPEEFLVFIPPFISRVFGGLLQEERGTQFNIFENEPTKS
jgi:hypothetical protein